MFDGLKILQTNVTIGRQYMRQMGRAAMATNMMVELCTAYPRHTLAGLEVPTATVVRVTCYTVQLAGCRNVSGVWDMVSNWQGVAL